MTCERVEMWIDEKPCPMILCWHNEPDERIDKRTWNREQRQAAKGLLRWVEIEERLGRRVGRKAMRRYLARQREERNLLKASIKEKVEANTKKFGIDKGLPYKALVEFHGAEVWITVILNPHMVKLVFLMSEIEQAKMDIVMWKMQQAYNVLLAQVRK